MISVIIPTYNRASCLGEAIRSVLDQEYFVRNGPSSFELLVVDDGSTDSTRDVVHSFGKRAKYHFQPNGGVSTARNKGLDLAQGDYIAFLDSDDLWEKEKIGSQLSFMKAFPEARVCTTEETWIRRGVFVNPKKKHQKYSGWIFDNVLPLCLLSLSSALFRKEIFEEIGRFDEELPVCEDYDLGIRIAAKYPVYLLPKAMIVKRGGHADQLSRKYWGMDRFRVIALEKALHLDLTPRQKELVRQELVKKYHILAKGYEKRNKHEEAGECFARIEKYRPGEPNWKMEEK
jgi:glycosyltransferase involved in cell wall biosynthesis